MRNRWRAVVVVIAIVLAGCGGGSGSKRASAPSTSASTAPGISTTQPHRASVTVGDCGGIGPAPAAAAGEITFVSGGALYAVGPDGGGKRCLARHVDDVRLPLEWRGAADGLLVGSTVLLSGAPALQEVTASGWSRPKGTALLVLRDGRLFRRDVASGAELDITFLERTESAIYHPAGRDVVAVGVGQFGYGIYLATNRGENVRPLAQAEHTNHIQLWGWTITGNLLFTGDHVDHQDLHQLDLATGQLATLATAPGDVARSLLAPVTASTFPGGGVAWRQGFGCDSNGPLTVVRSGNRVDLSGTPAATASPVGWLPGGTLVLFAVPPGCSERTGDVFTFHDGDVKLIAHDVQNVAVRAVLPPGPELPANMTDPHPPPA